MTAIGSRRLTLASASLVVAIALAACGAAKEQARLSVSAGAKAGELGIPGVRDQSTVTAEPAALLRADAVGTDVYGA